jgi:hypothetical protein
MAIEIAIDDQLLSIATDPSSGGLFGETTLDSVPF